MKKTILVVDDYSDARGFMKYLIEGFGFKVIEAENGQDAVEATKQYHPDLILMDISMPVMDGLTATKIIRKSGNGFSKTPIVAVSAFGESYYKKAIEAGCDDLLNKPLDFEELQPFLMQLV